MSWASLSMHSKTLRFTRWPHGSRSFTTRFLLFAKEISYATIKHCFLAFNSVFFVYMCKDIALIRIFGSLSLFKDRKNSVLLWFYYSTGCFTHLSLYSGLAHIWRCPSCSTSINEWSSAVKSVNLGGNQYVRQIRSDLLEFRKYLAWYRLQNGSGPRLNPMISY